MGHNWVALADEIRAELARRGWSGNDLAQRAGVSRRTVTRIMAGEPHKRPPQALARIEVAFGWRAGTARRILEEGSSAEPATNEDLAAAMDELLRRLEKLPPRYQRRVFEKVWREWLKLQEQEERDRGE